MTDLQPVDHKEKKISVLKKRKDFLRVARTQVKWVSPGMVVQTCPRDGTGAEMEKSIRVGFTASKKVGSAVRRNRAKRRLREAVRRVMPDKGRAGHDYVIIARAGLEDRTFDEVIRDLKWSLKRLAGPKKDTPAGRSRTPGGAGVSRGGGERT